MTQFLQISASLKKTNLLLCPPQHCGGLSTAGQRHGQHWNWYTLIFCLGFLHISAVSVSVNMVTCPQAYSEDYQEYSDSYCVKVICFENTDNFWWFCCETETLFAFVFACCCPMCQVREALLPCHWPWHFWHLSHIHNLFCVVALLLKVERRWRQIIGRLPSEGNTVLLLNHFGSVQWCLFWFNICRTPPTMLSTDDNVSRVSELAWLSISFREQVVTTFFHQCPLWTVWCWKLWSELPQAWKEAKHWG